MRPCWGPPHYRTPWLSSAAMARFKQTALLLQDGGARGSYQAGAYQALAGADLHPDWAVYLMGVVRGWSLVSRTKTASNFAGSVLLALRLIEWIAPGGSDQLSPAR